MTSIPSSELPSQEFLQAFRKIQRPFIVAHVTPDADAIGSALGLATAMRDAGIQATIGLPAGCVAKRLQFMIDLAPDTPRETEWRATGGFDAIVVLDTASEKRINIEPKIELAGSAPVFNIDHHVTNTDFGLHNWVDPHATSTCELVARLLKEMKWPIASRVASLLYAGVHGDTAGFSLPNTTANCLLAASDLLRAGADVAHIGEQLCRSQARTDFELLRRVYDHTCVTDDGMIAYSHLTHEDFLASGSKPEDIDDQVSIPLALRGVRMALLFTEGEKGVVRINLRGEGKTTVVELAQKFGGGGHTHAAGVRMKNKPIQDVIQIVLAAAREHLAGRG
ncbi:MAG: DHH family phosphoesterase [Planctomycetes bacterium]|nr:DHH family phosphoesterase [Planctomycetota bacterium]